MRVRRGLCWVCEEGGYVGEVEGDSEARGAFVELNCDADTYLVQKGRAVFPFWFLSGLGLH